MANRNRRLGDSARRITDELGKGQEVLRKASATFRCINVAKTEWATILVPDVGIKVVDISVTSNVIMAGSDANTLDVYKRSGGSDVELITQFDPDQVVAKTPSFRTLLAAASSVAGGEHISARLVQAATTGGVAATPSDITVEVSYILSDDERTYTVG